MSKRKFPPLIHLIWETPDGEKPYLIVVPGGVFEVEIHHQRIAVYKLVQTGRVEIRKRMVK